MTKKLTLILVIASVALLAMSATLWAQATDDTRVIQLSSDQPGGPRGTVVMYRTPPISNDPGLWAFEYNVQHLPCSMLHSTPRKFDQLSREFYAVYATMPSSGRIRIASFAPECAGGTFKSSQFLPNNISAFFDEESV